MISDLRAKSLNIISRLAAILLGVSVTLMTIQVVLRFGFNSPQAWAEEVDRYLFVWLVFLGAIVAAVRDTHIRVTVLIDPFGAPAKRFSNWLNRWLNVACFSFVGYWGYANAYQYRGQSFYTIDWMPQILYFLAAPVCMTLMVVYLLIPTRK